MAEARGEKGFLEGFEVITGNIIRRPFKRFLRRRLDLLRQTDEPAWLAAVWYHKREPDRAETFRNLMLGGLTAAEFFADWLAARTGAIGHVTNEGVTTLMEDLPFTLREYFEEQPDSVFPAGYPGPQPGDFERIAGRLNRYLREGMNTFRNWMRGGFVKDFLEFRQGFLVAKATTELGPEAMIDFSQWWMGLPQRVRHELQPALRAVNEAGEMGRLLLLDPGSPRLTQGIRPAEEVLAPETQVVNASGEVVEIRHPDPEPTNRLAETGQTDPSEQTDERLTFLRAVNSMNEWRFPLTRRQRRQLRVLWRKYFSDPVGEMTDWLAERNEELDPGYLDRPNWKVEFFSPANLKKYPHRRNLLKPDDPLRLAHERSSSRKHQWMVFLAVVAAGSFAVGTLAIQEILRGNYWWIGGVVLTAALVITAALIVRGRRTVNG
ncbi:MAG: hypothetical protein HYY50_04315 [Candidatus Kerfeldbacteria bacterium]|nr:hypothetical protein [Candidatus Kerfeldbacteria bacterium]